ncbi:MAG: DNA repair and recombination protein RadA [Candidatus Woesearchaeota archaeon]|nr:MAG: DNA repair and recombination protein RadA [Candidatus Woesearchaeota archaeon]
MAKEKLETEKSIEDLPGIGAKSAEKLKEAGYDSLTAIAVAPLKELADIGGLGEATAEKIIKIARDSLNMGFKTGDEVLEIIKQAQKLTTGSDELNKLIGGGIETQNIFEAFGEFGSGKSQIGMQLCVNCQLPVEKGGLGGSAIYIDTEKAFRPERIKQMAENVGLDPDKVLKNIRVARAYTTDHQILLAEKAEKLVKKKENNIRLVVVDSLMALFRVEYSGRGTLAERQQKLNLHLRDLQRIAEVYNAAVFVTNQVMAKPDMFFGDPTAAVGGHILGHASKFRVYLRKGKAGKRIARLIDSPYLPEGEAVFQVSTKGIEDLEQK